MKFLSVILSVALLISCGKTQISEDLSFNEWVKAYQEQTVEDKGMKGGISSMVYKEGEILFSSGTGWADADSLWTIDGDTPMPVGSISKIFTSVALMKLVEDGSVELDKAVGLYLPRLKLEEGREYDFTVRDLLTHHSGIPGDLFADWFDYDIDHLYELMEGRPLMAEPGTLFSYANTGFSLIALIIEEISGQSFESFVRENLFEPASMSNSYVHSKEAEEKLPRGYFKKTDISVPELRDFPAGGFIVSSNDMGRFIHSLFRTEDILGKEAFREMLTSQNENNAVDRNFSIGLGFWLIDPLNTGELTASHGGDLPPYHAILITHPDKEIAVFAAVNDHGKNGTIAMEAGLDIMKELLNRENITYYETDPGQTVPMNGEEMEPYGGVYGTMAGLIELEPADGYFKMKLGKIPLIVEKRDNGFYSAGFRPFNLFTIPVPQLEGMAIDLYEAEGKQWMGLWMKGVYMGAGSRLEPVLYNDDYARLVGDYSTPGGNNILEDGSYAISDIAVREKRGRYTLNVTLLGQKVEMALRHDGKGRAVTDGSGRGMGDSVRFRFDESDKPVIYWSGFELKR